MERFPTSNGQAADGTGPGRLSDACALALVACLTGVYVHGNSLFVTDNDNNRYLGTGNNPDQF